ncbi:MAG: type II secretion system F family protein [Candidatus Solibacter usitatus]|nr:type II secretion system F family protein [Candidatus Solibacter usitatus]
MHAIVILALFFLAVMSGTVWLGYGALFSGPSVKDGVSPLVETLRRIGRATPLRPEESGRLRQRLGLAGYRQPSAALIFSGIRVAIAALLALIVFGVGLYMAHSLTRILLSTMSAVIIGSMLPNRILDRRIRQRAERLRAGLPAALDLLVLGLEAGQALDATLAETARELRAPFPELNAELSLTQLEIFASKGRAEAFQNLAKRNQEIEIRRFAQVLIDSDRFGTSLAPALRTHVRYLRIRMGQRASEAARKVGVKLVFPVFFLIFPAVLLVTVGPAVLQIVTQLEPMLNSAVP